MESAWMQQDEGEESVVRLHIKKNYSCWSLAAYVKASAGK